MTVSLQNSVIYVNLCKFMQMSCDVIGHVMVLDNEIRRHNYPRGAPWWWNCSRPIRMSSKSARLSDNRGLYGGASSGNKRTTNHNAPFQISTNHNELQICLFLRIEKHLHTTFIVWLNLTLRIDGGALTLACRQVSIVTWRHNFVYIFHIQYSTGYIFLD